MITLYKQIETKGLYYKEMWYENADKVLIEHSGKVGYVGTIAKTSMTEKEAAIRLQDFSNVCASDKVVRKSIMYDSSSISIEKQGWKQTG